MKRAPKRFLAIRRFYEGDNAHRRRQLRVDKHGVLKEALDEILYGFRNLADSRDTLKAFVGRNVIGYTAMGYEYGPQDLQYAIDMVSSNPRLSPFRRRKKCAK